jgi:hypothetical protein
MDKIKNEYFFSGFSVYDEVSSGFVSQHDKVSKINKIKSLVLSLFKDNILTFNKERNSNNKKAIKVGS